MILVTLIKWAHRGKYTKNGTLHICVKFDRDDTALNLVKQFALNHNNTSVRCCQQFSKNLQNRRNLALKNRKELFHSKEIVKGYADYPATLKVMLQGSNKYTKFEDF